MNKIENKYVAFCDILGFSNEAKYRFDQTIQLYKEFRSELEKFPSFNLLGVSIYSDSILIVGDKLIDVTKTVQILLWTALRNGWLMRGGVAYGKHWEEKGKNNLMVVSQALVRAVEIEKAIRHPIVAIDDEIPLGLEYWLYGFKHTVFDLPIIHYDNLNIVTPFNNYWFKSAEIKLTQLKAEHPEHGTKHDYLLKMAEEVKNGKEFIPKHIINDLLEKKLIEKKEMKSS